MYPFARGGVFLPLGLLTGLLGSTSTTSPASMEGAFDLTASIAIGIGTVIFSGASSNGGSVIDAVR